jgi:phosphate-selective porin OprO/OprP
MKEPFSLEEMSSRRHMDMVNFSLLNQFVPAEDHGLTLLGRSGPLELGIGFYNGTGGPDTTSDKDAALRVVVHLFDGFQLGGAGTVGRQSIDISGEELITEARAPWAQYLPGTTVSGDRVRLGTEAAWLTGPFAATAEWMILREDLNDETVHVRGGYLQASYVLTGEDKTWKGVIPAHPFEKDPDVGAWQVVGRWSHLDPDESFENFLTADPNRLDSFTVGLNWHANRFAKAKLNVIRSAFEERIVIDGESIRTEDALIVQFQLQF